MYGYTPNERIVDRAVALWIEMLSAPKYDNLGENSPESRESTMQSVLASVLTSELPKNNTSEVLLRFGVELKKMLMAPTEIKFTNYRNEETITTQLYNYLSVDYHPDVPLSAAAERAGLKMHFPWKTSMFLDEKYLYVSYGYGAPHVYHYPLSSDRWLVTALSGDDVGKIVALVEAGKLDLNLNAT